MTLILYPFGSILSIFVLIIFSIFRSRIPFANRLKSNLFLAASFFATLDFIFYFLSHFFSFLNVLPLQLPGILGFIPLFLLWFAIFYIASISDSLYKRLFFLMLVSLPYILKTFQTQDIFVVSAINWIFPVTLLLSFWWFQAKHDKPIENLQHNTA